MPNPPVNQSVQSPVKLWRAAGMFQDTKENRIWRNAAARNSFSGPGGFMDTKRQNPQASYGSSDKLFKSNGKFAVRVPGIKHAHITHDLSVVYKVEGNNIYLYGFFTHDELGTGQPANIRKQDAMATRFSNTEFLEETKG